jgi:hypothetical protein
MKIDLGRATNTVNAHLTALDHFFTHRGPGPAVVKQDDPPKLAVLVGLLAVWSAR